jgi:hypothetical protein
MKEVPVPGIPPLPGSSRPLPGRVEIDPKTVGKKLEDRLARVVPAAIDFLAGTLGLGGVGDGVRTVVEEVRDRVEPSAGHVVGRVEGAVQDAAGAVGDAAGAVASAAGAVADAFLGAFGVST